MRPPTTAPPLPPASTPRSIATPTIPIATPTRADALSRCSPLSANASRKVKIGALATRIPVSDDAMCSSPSPINVSGPATWTSERTTIGPSRPRRLPSTPSLSASGTRTAVASAVRMETIAQAEKTSSSATLMNRYDAPHRALSVKRRTTERRDIRSDVRRRSNLWDAAGARLAGAQEALADVALVLRRGVEGRRVRQRVEPTQPEQLLEQLGGAVHDRAEARAPGLLDQPALEQRADRGLRCDAADPRHLRPRHGLQVRHDRQALRL